MILQGETGGKLNFNSLFLKNTFWFLKHRDQRMPYSGEKTKIKQILESYKTLTSLTLGLGEFHTVLMHRDSD